MFKGARVKHPKFGLGTVVDVKTLRDLFVIVVKFDDPSIGVKDLVLGVAQLKLSTHSPREILNDPKACLRVIQSLKAGRAPREGIRFLSVGVDKVIKRLQRAFIQALQHKPQTLWLIGDYGEGKSHMLRLIAALAEEHRFAWAYVVHDKDQFIGLHKPAWLYRRLLFELQWNNPNLDLSEDFEREKEEFERICKSLKKYYPTSWKERAEYKYDRNMRKNLIHHLAQIATRLHDGKWGGLVICIDELENCCQLYYNQHLPAYETLSQLLFDLPNCPLILCFGFTRSGFESLQNQWYRHVHPHVGDKLIELFAYAEKNAITMPPLNEEYALQLTKRISRLHASAFDWQPTIDVQKIMKRVWKKAAGHWRTFVQLVVTQLEVAHQESV